MLSASLLALQIPVTQTQATISPSPSASVIQSSLEKPVVKEFPNRDSNYQEMVKQKERVEAERKEAERIQAEQRALELQKQQYSTPQVTTVSTPLKTPQTAPSGGGGYIIPGYNCVECVKRLTGRSQNGNAGQWMASSSTPSIGAVMIFYAGEQGASYAGHVAVISRIYPDGSVDVIHCNWSGGQTHFYSTGKFW